MSSILACHPQRPLRGEADSKEENEMFNDNRFAATNRGCISATIRDNARRRRVLPRVRPPAYRRRKTTANRGAVLHEVRPYIGD